MASQRRSRPGPPKPSFADSYYASSLLLYCRRDAPPNHLAIEPRRSVQCSQYMSLAQFSHKISVTQKDGSTNRLTDGQRDALPAVVQTTRPSQSPASGKPESPRNGTEPRQTSAYRPLARAPRLQHLSVQSRATVCRWTPAGATKGHIHASTSELTKTTAADDKWCCAVRPMTASRQFSRVSQQQHVSLLPVTLQSTATSHGWRASRDHETQALLLRYQPSPAPEQERWTIEDARALPYRRHRQCDRRTSLLD